MGNCLGKKNNKDKQQQGEGINRAIQKRGTIIDYNQSAENDWNANKTVSEPKIEITSKIASNQETSNNNNTYTGSPLFGENDSQISMSQTMPKSNSINHTKNNNFPDSSDSNSPSQSNSPTQNVFLETVVEVTENTTEQNCSTNTSFAINLD